MARKKTNSQLGVPNSTLNLHGKNKSSLNLLQNTNNSENFTATNNALFITAYSCLIHIVFYVTTTQQMFKLFVLLTQHTKQQHFLHMWIGNCKCM